MASKTPRTRTPRRTLGQAATELALVLPLFILFFTAIVEMGYMFFSEISIKHAAREAVRRAYMNNVTRQQIRDVVVNSAVGVYIEDPVNQIQITTRATDATFPRNPPTVTVEVKFDYKPLVMGILKQSPVPIRAIYRGMVTTYTGRDHIMF